MSTVDTCEPQYVTFIVARLAPPEEQPRYDLQPRVIAEMGGGHRYLRDACIEREARDVLARSARQLGVRWAVLYADTRRPVEREDLHSAYNTVGDEDIATWLMRLSSPREPSDARVLVRNWRNPFLPEPDNW